MTEWIDRLGEDVAALRARDPATRSWTEALLCAPGMHAVWAHRLLHPLHEFGARQGRERRPGGSLRLVARVLAHGVRAVTGVEIHPGAQLGRRVVIDHGHGVVIGETAVVGDDCTLYHGVTLGGSATENVKRHPTLGRGVLVGANATILGPVTIGDEARLGAGAVVVDRVKTRTTVVGPRARPSEEGPARRDARPGNVVSFL